MAWNEVKQTMSFRQEIVRLGTQPGTNIRELCRRFQISAKTFYKWLKRLKAEGEAGLENRSRRPRESPKRTAIAVENRIKMVRTAHPSWGARKIRRILINEGKTEVPADSTVHRILERNGDIDKRESSKHQAWRRFEHEAPNQLWQMDFKGWFRTIDQRRCNPLTILDDHSRYVVCLQACLDQRTATVQKQLVDTFRRYGMPQRMTMDNGSPWGNDLVHRYTPLTVWLIRLGIGVSHSRPFHPQTQGKDERFHRTLDVDLLQWHHFRDLLHVQKHFDEYRQIYNRERPHQALGLDVPANRYQISSQSYPEHLPTIEYDTMDVVRRVQPRGNINLGGMRYIVGKAFSGLPVAIRPTTMDGTFNVVFCHQRIAQINVHEKTILSVVEKPVETAASLEIRKRRGFPS